MHGSSKLCGQIYWSQPLQRSALRLLVLFIGAVNACFVCGSGALQGQTAVSEDVIRPGDPRLETLDPYKWTDTFGWSMAFAECYANLGTGELRATDLAYAGVGSSTARSFGGFRANWDCPRTSTYRVVWTFSVADDGWAGSQAVEVPIVGISAMSSIFVELSAKMRELNASGKVVTLPLCDKKQKLWAELGWEVFDVVAGLFSAVLEKKQWADILGWVGKLKTFHDLLGNKEPYCEFKPTDPRIDLTTTFDCEEGKRYVIDAGMDVRVHSGRSFLALIAGSCADLTMRLESITIRDLNPPSGPILQVEPSELDFGSLPRGRSTTQKLHITNSGDENLEWSIAADPDCPWITDPSPTSGISSPGYTIPVDVTVNTSGLSDGDHSCSVTVSSNAGGPLPITVKLNVHPGGADTTVTVDAAPRADEVYVRVDIYRRNPEVRERHVKFFGNQMPQSFKADRGKVLRFKALSLSDKYVGKKWDVWLDGQYQPQNNYRFPLIVEYDTIEATAIYDRQYLIAGTVTHLATGLGLAGVTVSAEGRSAVTDSNGRYTLEYFPPGTHTLSASKTGYAMQPATHQVTLGPDRTDADFIARDTAWPGPPLVSSPTHPFADSWSPDDSPAFEWSTPEDPSGIAQYSYALNQIEDYVPGENEGPPTASNSIGPLSVPHGGAWWFHVRAKDRVGNWGPDAGHYKLNIDTSKPGVVSDLASTSHETETWSNDTTIDVAWTAAPDSLSGVLGYTVIWDHFTGSLPPADPGSLAGIVGGDEASVTSPQLADADDWYFHIRAIDHAGNAADVPRHLGPFYIDSTAPALVSASAEGPTKVKAEFNDEMENSSAEVVGNYTIEPGINVTAAALLQDGRTVELTTSPLQGGVTYTLTVGDVKDKAGNAVDPANNQQPLMLGYTVSGSVLHGSTPIEGVRVDVVARTSGSSVSDTTDATGYYEVHVVETGTYDVTPSKPGYSFNPSSPEIEVVDADVTDVDFQGNRPPAAPESASPDDNEPNVTLTTSLTWQCSDPDGDPLTYDVYLGKTDPPPLKQDSHGSTTYDPGKLDPDTTYYWKVVAKDSFDFDNEAAGLVWQFTTAEEFTYPFPAGLGLYGVPCAPLNPDAQAVFGTDKVAWWDPAIPGDDKYVYQPDPPTSVDPGKGLWVRFNEPDRRIIEGSAVPLDTPFTYPQGSAMLLAGWNLCGNAFQADIPWSGVSSQPGGSIMPFAWVYPPGGGSYELIADIPGLNINIARDNIHAWEGFWIKATADCRLKLQPPGAAAAASRSRAAEEGISGWVVQLIASTAQVRDAANLLGVLEQPTRQAGLARIDNPPAFPGCVDLYFVPEDAHNAARWATDLRTAGSPDKVWNLVVETDLPDADVTVTWPDLSQVPKHCQLTLIDSDAGKTCHMGTRSSYTFASGPNGGQRHFRVELKTAPTNLLAVTNVVAVPLRGGAGSISYNLSRSAAVTVTIYNVAGRLVRRVTAAAEQLAGRNSVIWDSRSESGSVVPNGLYLCRISAADESGQKAQAVATLVVQR